MHVVLGFFLVVYFGVNLHDASQWAFHFFFYSRLFLWCLSSLCVEFFEIPCIAPLFSESLEPLF